MSAPVDTTETDQENMTEQLIPPSIEASENDEGGYDADVDINNDADTSTDVDDMYSASDDMPKRDEYHVPDTRNAMLTLIAAVVIAIFISALEIIPPQTFPRQEDTPSQARIGVMYSMQNLSQDICDDFYNYSCGQYNKRYSYSTLFSETQYQINNLLWNSNSLPVIDRTHPTGSLSSAGFYGCYTIEIRADYTRHNRRAVYVYPYNSTGEYTIHPVTSTDYFPPSVANVIERAFESNANVYWFQESYTVQEWYDACNDDGLDVEQYHFIANMSTRTLVETYYFKELDTKYALPNQNINDARAIVSKVRARTITYIQQAPWMSPETRQYLLSRIQTLAVEIGVSSTETCDYGKTLYQCLVYLHNLDIGSLDAFTSPSKEWQMNALDVNAEYDPLSDVIYIPWGIFQTPFYNPMWSDVLKMATIGQIMSHEIGHYVDISPFNNVSIHLAADLLVLQTCISEDYSRSGSIRPNSTVVENWADWWSLSTTAIPTEDYYVIRTQMWCASGVSWILNTTDPHSSPYLRGSVPLYAFNPFLSLFGCSTFEIPCGSR